MTMTVDQFLERDLTATVGQPLRVAVYSRIAEGIRGHVFPLGSALPRETELGASLGVSRTVVREALMLLEEDGLIVTKRGVGRFVATSIPRVGLEELRPFEQALSDGDRALTVRPVEFTMQPTTDFISNKLALDLAANTWFRESVIEQDGEPIAIVQEHFPAGRYLSDVSPAIAEHLEAAAEAKATLLAGLIERVGPVFGSGVCQIAVNVAGASRAKLLDLGANDPVLILTQTAELDGTPIYLAKCIVSTRVGHLSIVQASQS
ncbi:GntR family transcriptional regulator [Leifsonia sp. NCR5]|uniref:GntR family transcriptional regulator n=1 Tax=Leifsonia sp. NCR5 TaxID=1978342 RepID=UPI002119EE47|nr:GntR family transcriptional regulator [Leifsonia sp. NCR5]